MLRLLIVVTLSLVSLGVPSMQGASSQTLGPVFVPLSGPVPEAPGTLVHLSLFPGNAGFGAYEPSTGRSWNLQPLPAGSVVDGMATSPDGTSLAVSTYRPGQQPSVTGGTELQVMGWDGSSPRTLLALGGTGGSVSDPVWAPEGDSLYFTRRAMTGQPGLEQSSRRWIEWASLDGTQHYLIVPDGHSPTASPDGQELAYLVTESTLQGQTLTNSHALWVANTFGTEQRRILADDGFWMLSSPRFSPDGRRIAFAAVGSPVASQAAPEKPAGLMRLGPSVAHAHGVPWDFWVIDRDGSNLRRLTSIGEDVRVMTWSPDGEWLAFSGEYGLYLVKVEDGQIYRLNDAITMSWLGWLP